ncbi:hemerythrin domain-containing protein [Ferruginibacter sp.]|nr:hemerythrin domain-containing protein [Ferruginibacter sp.]
MKRHEALAPLSREHHDALILAQLLKKNAPVYKGLPQLPKDKAVYATNFYHSNLQKHFKQEEQMLHKVKQYNSKIEEITPEIIYEHEQLTQLFISLDKTADLQTTMDTLGKALEAHVRKEERILFPLIQEHCPAEILNSIEL